MAKENPIKEKSYNFALRIIKLYKYLSQEKQEFVLSKQILRSGTAIGALVEEALQGESKADFIHKLSISLKEANETHYWLRLLRDTGYVEENAAGSIINNVEELIKILTKIIKTTKSNGM